MGQGEDQPPGEMVREVPLPLVKPGLSRGPTPEKARRINGHPGPLPSLSTNCAWGRFPHLQDTPWEVGGGDESGSLSQERWAPEGGRSTDGELR